MGSLEGKVVAITGASSGIGEALAHSCVAEGAAVSLAARRGDRLDALVAKLDGKALAVETDVADEASARAFVAKTVDELGGLDVLVNNAGVMLLGPVAGADVEQWRRMIDVNALGLLYCTHAALSVMGERGGGHIVNVSSVAGRRAAMGAAVYNLTKFGVTGFSEALRQEALHAKVRVSVVEPGFVETELQGHNELDVVKDAIESMRESIGDVLQAHDVADAIRYIICAPQHVNVAELVIIPTGQRS